jgi:hypothetical protein
MGFACAKLEARSYLKYKITCSAGVETETKTRTFVTASGTTSTLTPSTVADLEGDAKTADGARGILSRSSTRTDRSRGFRENTVARAVRAALPLHHRHVLPLKLSFTIHARRFHCVLLWSPQVALCGSRPCGMLVGYGMREGGSCVVS